MRPSVFSCYYVFYITTTPYLPCNNKNINRKELYDFYYTAITLTTGYNIIYVIGVGVCVGGGAGVYVRGIPDRVFRVRRTGKH